MTRLRATMVLGLVLFAVLGVVGATVRVPFVALGEGPTFDVLGRGPDGAPVITVGGPVRTYPTTGQLRMTTVSVTNQVTLFGALALWAGGDSEVVPRDSVYPPGQTRQQTEADNTRQFSQSETDARTAALRYLGYPAAVAVKEVSPGGPAAPTLRPEDRIVTVDGRPMATPQDVVAAVAPVPPGRPVAIRVLRAGVPTDTTVVAAPRPGDPTRGYLGIVPGSEVDSPAQVTIRLGDVGGPSAGLAFATGVIDQLTPGDLLGGRAVAGTGTIDAAGRVGPIGGIALKMDGARRDGATTFLVPADNCAEASADAPAGMTLARVATLGDAVTALEDLKAGRVPPRC